MTPNGVESLGSLGFPNTNGQDEAMTRASMADIEANYCVDKARHFSTGFSYGSSMSYTSVVPNAPASRPNIPSPSGPRTVLRTPPCR